MIIFVFIVFYMFKRVNEVYLALLFINNSLFDFDKKSYIRKKIK